MSGARHDWTEFVRRMAQPIIENATAAGMAPRSDTSKYRSVRCRVEGLNFASQLEADRYRELKLLQASGDVAWFIRQVPFDVAPGVVYRADFLVVWHDPQPVGSSFAITVEDCKGMMTPNSRTKIAVVEQRYGIQIRLLTRAEVGKP